MRFDWNPDKSRANRKKHGVSFEEAQTVFFDDRAILFDDPDDADDEERFLLLGPSDALRILVVVHCYRENDEVIRIISARKATSSELGAFIAAWSKP